MVVVEEESGVTPIVVFVLWIPRFGDGGVAGHPPELKCLPTSPIFLGFSCFSHHFEGQWYWKFYGKTIVTIAI